MDAVKARVGDTIGPGTIALLKIDASRRGFYGDRSLWERFRSGSRSLFHVSCDITTSKNHPQDVAEKSPVALRETDDTVTSGNFVMSRDPVTRYHDVHREVTFCYGT